MYLELKWVTAQQKRLGKHSWMLKVCSVHGSWKKKKASGGKFWNRVKESWSRGFWRQNRIILQEMDRLTRRRMLVVKQALGQCQNSDLIITTYTASDKRPHWILAVRFVCGPTQTISVLCQCDIWNKCCYNFTFRSCGLHGEKELQKERVSERAFFRVCSGCSRQHISHPPPGPELFRNLWEDGDLCISVQMIPCQHFFHGGLLWTNLIWPFMANGHR